MSPAGRRSRFGDGKQEITREGRGPRATTFRRRKALESYSSAALTIGPIEAGLSIFALTRGQFSMIDMVRHIATEIGPCAVSIWTWVTADYDVEAMGGLLADGVFTSGRLVIDRSTALVRTPAMLEAWRARFGPDTIRMCAQHAKMARVWNDRYRVLLRGSMNLNFNPRFEQIDVTEGGGDFDLVASVENELPDLPVTASREEVLAATGIGLAWEASALAMYRGVKSELFRTLKPWKD